MLRVSVFATRDNPTAGSRRTIRKASFEDPVEEVPAPEPSQASSRAKAQLASAPPPRTWYARFAARNHGIAVGPGCRVAASLVHSKGKTKAPAQLC
jgi:hypothetical protein